MNAVTRFHRPRWVIARVIDDKTVLYQADSGEVFYLEGTAVAMWRWIAERVDDLVEQSLLHIGEAAACR